MAQEWTVGALMSDGSVAVYLDARYPSEAAAAVAAKRRHADRPFMNYVAVPVRGVGNCLAE